MAGKNFTKDLRQIIRRACRKRFCPRLLGQFLERNLVELAIRIQSDRIDWNSCSFGFTNGLAELFIRFALLTPCIFVEVVVAIGKQNDHRLMPRVGSILQYLNGFLNPNRNIGVRASI
ncbi:hypothetical protein D3C78_1102590 [compost metagenome]